MIISNHLDLVRSDIRGDIYLHALELERQGKRVLKLNTGNPAAFGFKMPKSIQTRIIVDAEKALGYCDIKGMPASRTAICDYHRARGVKGITEEDIFIGNGVSEVADMIITALIGAGEEILAPAPCYSLWSNLTYMTGGRVRFYQCDESNGWQPDLESIRRSITSRTRAIVVINPNNPTGAVYRKDILLGILELARKNKLTVISDEIYDRLVLEGKVHIPMGSLAEDVTVVTMNGLSKSHCICGLRCGWLCISGPEGEKAPLREALVKIASVRLCSNALMQLVIPDALADSDYTEQMIAPQGRMPRQRQAVMEELDQIDGIHYVANEAAFYLFPRIDLLRYGFENDRDFARQLLDEKNILVIPGSGFNCPDQYHFRIVMLPEEEELRRAIRRIGTFLREREW